MADIVTAYVSETGESSFAVRIETGAHVLIGDEPPEDGGADLGPAPYQLLASALGECTAMTVRWYARKENWPLEHVACEVIHRKAEIEGLPGKTDVFRKIVTIRGDALTDEQRARLIDVAGKCPVHRTLEKGSRITTVSE